MRNGADMRIKRGTGMRIKRGTDMRIKRGADMGIKRGADLCCFILCELKLKSFSKTCYGFFIARNLLSIQ